MRKANKKAKIIRLRGNKCFYCGTDGEFLTIDHCIPKSRGGSNSIANLVPACRSCNGSKQNMTLHEFRAKKDRETKQQSDILEASIAKGARELNWSI